MSEDREKRYLGLSNQGATCYMNSLLQALFMTPEVRAQIYSYNQVLGQNEIYNIPLQLQKLFARLQLAKQGPIETTNLTKSFHWTSSESFQQQDVQEFCRVLFDAIDVSVQQTTGTQDAVSSLFQGTSQSFVKCLTCGFESQNQTTFLDLNLPIRNEFGTGVLNSSLEMALENYIKPELLNGDNQYYCEKCGGKRDAEKGIKLTKGPQILSIVLNRFTLDYNTFQRVKLHERVSFPLSINLEDYLQGYDGISSKKYDQEVQLMNQYQKSKVENELNRERTKEEKITAKKGGEATQTTKEKEVVIKVMEEQPEEEPKPQSFQGSFDEKTYQHYLTDTSGPRTFNLNTNVEDDETEFYDQITKDLRTEIDQQADSYYSVKHTNEKFAITQPGARQDVTGSKMLTEDEELEIALKQIREMEESTMLQTSECAVKGENVYDLYAILIHQGGAFGGHYFAYIKSFEDGQWYNFNDSNVTQISQSDITNTFGGSNGTNTAYMLMYTKKGGLPQFDVPAAVREQIRMETEKLIQEQLVLEEKALALDLKIWFNGTQELVPAKKNWKFHELRENCCRLFGLGDGWRFRVYDNSMQVRRQVVQLEPAAPLHQSPLLARHIQLDIELGPDFESYCDSTLFLKVHVWEADQDYNFQDLHRFPFLVVKTSLKQTTEELEHKIAAISGIPAESLVILLRHEQSNGHPRIEYFNLDWRKPKTLQECSKFEHGHHLFVEGSRKFKFEEMSWKRDFDKDAHRVLLHCNDPNIPDSYSFNMRISVQNSDTIQTLKEVISAKTGLPLNSFYLMKQLTQKELKEMNKTVQNMCLMTGNEIMIVRGKPRHEGEYEITFVSVALTDQGPDSQLFTKVEIGTVFVKVADTGAKLRQIAFEAYQKKFPEHNLDFAGFRIRNPMNDIGTVIKDTDLLDSMYLYDGKEIYFQVDQPDKFVGWSGPSSGDFYHILVREWNQQTWELGPVKEVQFPKLLKTHDFGSHLKQMYPHIEQMFGCRVGLMKGFVRSDLHLKKWFQVATSGAGNQLLNLSQHFEISRDGILIVVKDNRIVRKPDDPQLTEEQVKMWCNQSYLDHMKKKDGSFSYDHHKDHEALLTAAQTRQVDWSKPLRSEKGVKITVSDQSEALAEQKPGAQQTEETGIIFEPFF